MYSTVQPFRSESVCSFTPQEYNVCGLILQQWVHLKYLKHLTDNNAHFI